MGSAGGAQAVKRIQRELKEIMEAPSKHWTAGPAADDLFEWQFAVRGPPGTDFEGGIYTGRLVLPVNYPLAPPSITMLTPNGRWEVGKKICLSNTNYHPDEWQPAWGIRTMMEALRAHFPVPGDGAIAAIDWPSDLRRKLAKESLEFVCGPGNRRNKDLLPELSPDEIKEDQPEPVPADLKALAPEPRGDAAAAAAAAAPAAAGVALGVEPVATPASGTGVDTAGSHLPDTVAATEAAAATAARPRPANAPATAPSTGAEAAASPPAVGAGVLPPRRRRDGQRPQRRHRPLLVQLLKPPTNGRGWVIFMIDILMILLALSFLNISADILRNPPTLLDQAPGAGEAKVAE